MNVSVEEPEVAAQLVRDDEAAVLNWLADGSFLMPESASELRADVDALLKTRKPTDSLAAAQQRLALLAKLRETAPNEPRVAGIFIADPVIASFEPTGQFVLASMVDARFGLINLVRTLLGQEHLDARMRQNMSESLAEAFPVLSFEAQREWMLSEVRLEEGLRFAMKRQPEELRALSRQLLPVFETDGQWRAMRLYSLASCLALGDSVPSFPVGDLLELSDQLESA